MNRLRVLNPLRAERITPMFYDGMPHCSGHGACPQYAERFKKDGSTRERGRWFCRLGGQTWGVCEPAVKRMTKGLGLA